MNFANTSVLLSSKESLTSIKESVSKNEGRAIYSSNEQIALKDFNTGVVDESDCFFYHLLDLNEALHEAETEYLIEYYRDLTDSINGTAVMHEDGGDDEKGIIGFFKKIFRAIGNFFKTIWNWITGKSKENETNKLPKIKELAAKLKEDESKSISIKVYHYPNIKNFKNDPFLQAVEGISKRIEAILGGNDNNEEFTAKGVFDNFVKGLSEHRKPNAGAANAETNEDFQKYINENITWVEDKTMNLKEFKKFCEDFVTNNEGHSAKYAELIKAFEDKSKALEKKVESFKNDASHDADVKEKAKNLMTIFSDANKAYASMINAISGWETKATDYILEVLEKEVNGEEKKDENNAKSDDVKNKAGLVSELASKANLDKKEDFDRLHSTITTMGYTLSLYGVSMKIDTDGKVHVEGELSDEGKKLYGEDVVKKWSDEYQKCYDILKNNPKAGDILLVMKADKETETSTTPEGENKETSTEKQKSAPDKEKEKKIKEDAEKASQKIRQAQAEDKQFVRMSEKEVKAEEEKAHKRIRELEMSTLFDIDARNINDVKDVIENDGTYNLEFDQFEKAYKRRHNNKALPVNINRTNYKKSKAYKDISTKINAGLKEYIGLKDRLDRMASARWSDKKKRDEEETERLSNTTNPTDKELGMDESASIHGEPFNSDTLFDNEDYRDFNPSTWLDVQLKTETYALNYEIREFQRRVALQEAVILSDENPLKYQRLIAMREAEESRLQKNTSNILAAIKKALNLFLGKVKDTCNANTAFVKKYKAFIDKPIKITGIKSTGDILAGKVRIRKDTQLVPFNSIELKDDLVDAETFFKNKVYNNYKDTSSFSKRNVTLDDAGSMKKYLTLYFGGSGEGTIDFETSTMESDKNNILDFIQNVNMIIARINNTLDKIELEMKRVGAEVDKKKDQPDNKPVEDTKPADNTKPAEGEASKDEAKTEGYYSILYGRRILTELTSTDPDKGPGETGEGNAEDIAKMAQVYLSTYSTVLTTQITCAEFVTKELMDAIIAHVKSYMTPEQIKAADFPEKPGQEQKDETAQAQTTQQTTTVKKTEVKTEG